MRHFQRHFDPCFTIQMFPNYIEHLWISDHLNPNSIDWKEGDEKCINETIHSAARMCFQLDSTSFLLIYSKQFRFTFCIFFSLFPLQRRFNSVRVLLFVLEFKDLSVCRKTRINHINGWPIWITNACQWIASLVHLNTDFMGARMRVKLKDVLYETRKSRRQIKCGKKDFWLRFLSV